MGEHVLSVMIDLDACNLSISTLVELMGKMSPGQKANLVNVSREDLDLLRVALDCYSHISQEMKEISEAVEGLTMIQKEEAQRKIDEWKATYGSLGTAFPNATSSLTPYTWKTYATP